VNEDGGGPIPSPAQVYDPLLCNGGFASVLSLPGAVPPGPLLAQKAPLRFAFFNSTILIQLIYCTCISFQKFEIFVKKIKAEIFQKSRGDETEKFINSI